MGLLQLGLVSFQLIIKLRIVDRGRRLPREIGKKFDFVIGELMLYFCK